ncbi:receptor activity-modifying protein 1 [Oryzias latipes]
MTAVLMAHVFTWTVLFSSGMASTFAAPPCDQNMFNLNLFDCVSDFNKSMETSGYQKNCPWPEVKGIYFKFSSCVDSTAVGSWCKGYKSVVNEVFMEVHQRYFPLCTNMQDPPTLSLILMTAPVIIATFLLPLLVCPLITKTSEKINDVM